MTTNLRKFLGAGAAAAALAAVVASCGGTGGGGGREANRADQFVLNSSNAGNLLLNVDPTTVDANKSDRLGVVATLTQRNGLPIPNQVITFSSDIQDIRFIGLNLGGEEGNIETVGFATTDENGNADIIAVAGSTPTSTGGIIGRGSIFAQAPPGFSLSARVSVTLTDVGFIDSAILSVIPPAIILTEPSIGSVVFFNIVGGVPPYILKNEASGVGVATLSNHCAPGCTENSDNIIGLCIGSPCLTDGDCNEDGSAVPADVCIGAIQRCLASCQGTNCGGSRCDTDADCNDGSPTPANVCKDSGQSVVYTVLSDAFGNTDPTSETPTDSFIVEDSAGASVVVDITINFFCGNGVRRGPEQCDGGDGIVSGESPTSCEDLGFLGGILLCSEECTFDTSNCLTMLDPNDPNAP